MVTRGVVDDGDSGVDDFAEVVRRDVGRHADADAGGAVNQQVRSGRQDRRFADLLVAEVGTMSTVSRSMSVSSSSARRSRRHSVYR